MEYNIEVLSSVVTTIPTAKGSYQQAEIAYKDLKDGKVNGRKVMSFTCKEGFNLLQTGAKLTVVSEKETGKDGKDYNVWKKITAFTGSVPASATPSPRSNYETPEERAKRQEFIIRQSSLATAVACLKTDKVSPKPEDVIALADMFVNYVYDIPASVEALPAEDVPY